MNPVSAMFTSCCHIQNLEFWRWAVDTLSSLFRIIVCHVGHYDLGDLEAKNPRWIWSRHIGFRGYTTSTRAARVQIAYVSNSRRKVRRGKRTRETTRSNGPSPPPLERTPKVEEKTLLKREGGVSLSKTWRVLLISPFLLKLVEYIAYDDIFVTPNII